MLDLNKIIIKPVSKSDGPFMQAIDKALSSFNVQRQVYYSGIFVGNHVYPCLMVKVSSNVKIKKNNKAYLCTITDGYILSTHSATYYQLQPIRFAPPLSVMLNK